MAADTKANVKTLRVDNWAVFFLQRLQLMFAKGDCCDLTLKFHTGQVLKVHRLVLITCTTYFENMQKDGDVICMPEALPYSVVQPIINFLYSGKLEFKSELHSQLLSTSKTLNITILVKLLITQKNDNGMGVIAPTPKGVENKKVPQRTFLATRIGPAPGAGMAARKLPIWRQRTLPMYRMADRRVIKEEEAKPTRFEWPEGETPSDNVLLTSPSFTPLSYESEPVFTPIRSSTFPRLNRSPSPTPLPETTLKRRLPPSTIIPEKFFKDDRPIVETESEIKKEGNGSDPVDFSDDDDGHFETIHSFGDSDDEPDQDPTQITPVPKPIVPSLPQPLSQVAHTYLPPSKNQHHTLTSATPTHIPAPQASSTPLSQLPPSVTASDPLEPIPESPSCSATTPPPSTHTLLTPKPILKPNTELTVAQTPAKKVRFSIADDEAEVNVSMETDTEATNQTQKGSTKTNIHVPISTPLNVSSLLQPSTNVPPADSVKSFQTDTKIVQSVTDKSSSLKAVPDSPSVVSSASMDTSIPQESPSSPIAASTVSTPKPAPFQTYTPKFSNKTEKKAISSSSTNHAKIIAEVLKKYPELVKNNKNIRLKISAPGTSNVTNTLTLDTKRASGKAAYVVVKSSVKTENSSGIKSEIPSSSNMAPSSTYQPVTSLGNITGPWSCSTCGKDGEPMRLLSYYEFRKHFQDVHNERFDSKMCEYCGYKTSKRNLLLYHLFTKHDVTPKNICFPKCEHCGYVALSDGLLQKHLATHVKDHTCPQCNISFSSQKMYNVHVSSCKVSNNETRNYSCSYCNQGFRTNLGLNAHVKVCSLSVANNSSVKTNDEHSEDAGHAIYENAQAVGAGEQTVEMIEVPIIQADSLRSKAEHTFVQLPSGLILTDNPNVALLPSSDATDLNAVGSNIGTPIGLTVALPQDQHVILLDSNSEFYIQGNDSMVVSRINDNNEEYIVPEVLDDGIQQIYSTQTIPYSVATTGGNMITCPVVPIQSTPHIIKDQLEKHDESSSNTVVRVQDQVDPNELENMHIQHHVSTADLESIIVHDGSPGAGLEQQRLAEDTPVDIYVEEPPSRHSMTINKELMDVVAMEVQRSPNLLDHRPHVITLPERLQPQLPDTSDKLSCSEVANVNTEYQTEETPSLVSDETPRSIEDKTDIIEVLDSEDVDDTESLDASPAVVSQPASTEQKEIDDDDELCTDDSIILPPEGESAKADSLVKDWGFDNEEEGDAVETDEDDSSDEGARRGPSRVTVEL